MTKRSHNPATWLGRRAGAWLAGLRGRGDTQALAGLDELTSHLPRDVGVWRERSAGPRRFDPWM